MAFIIARDGPSSDLFLTVSKQEAQLTIQRLKIDEAVVRASRPLLVRWFQQGARHHRRCSPLVANLYEGGRPAAGAGYRMARTCCRYRRPWSTSRTPSSPVRVAPITAKRRGAPADVATTARSSRAHGHATALRASHRHTQAMSHTSAIVEPSQLSPALVQA